MSDRIWRQSDDWVGTEIDGSFVMVSVESGKYVALNETAHAIWDALEAPRTDQAVLEYLREHFDLVAGDGHEADVEEALKSMHMMSLLERTDSPA